MAVGRHEGLDDLPLIADFTTTPMLPPIARGKPRLGFFSGSTIGNLTHAEARAFLPMPRACWGRAASFSSAST